MSEVRKGNELPPANSLGNLSVLATDGAGVLGGISLNWLLVRGNTEVTDDLNKLPRSGLYCCKGATLNCPILNTSGSVVLHMDWANGIIFQLFFGHFEEGIWYRHGNLDSLTDWRKIH